MEFTFLRDFSTYNLILVTPQPPSLEPLPPVRAQGKIEEIRRALDGLRTQCTTLETNLSLALEPSAQSERKKTSSQLQKESKQLLAEVGTQSRCIGCAQCMCYFKYV